MSDNALKNIYASCIGSLIAEIITTPICTIKTVYQNNKSFTVSATIKHIYEMNGMKGFITLLLYCIIL